LAGVEEDLKMPSAGVCLVVAAALFALAPAGVAQEAPHLLAVPVRLADYGISGLSDIVRGRIAVSHGSAGDRLAVHNLRDTPPPVFPRTVRSAVPDLDGGCFRLEESASPRGNALGGRFSTFRFGGSTASVGLVRDESGRPALRSECDVSGGACGFWMHLFDTEAMLERVYLDATPVWSVSMWVRSGTGGEAILLKAADARWERIGDALPVGDVSVFTAEGRLTGRWQRAVVPLAAFPPRVSRDSLASLVFQPLDEGRTTLEVTGIEFCPAGGDPGPLPEGRPAEPEPGEGERALWVWNTEELLSDAAALDTFVTFLEEERYTRAFLQLVPASGARASAGFVPFDQEGMGRLIALLGAVGVRVYALDGDPAYALPVNHPGVFATVRRVVEHNRTRPEAQRFHGVRYDVEPYLLPGFPGPRREEILGGWLTMMAGIRELAHGGGLRVGVDVPFWLDSPDEESGRPMEVTRDGSRSGILSHMLRLVDDVGIMAYRTSAHGADGSVVHSWGELEMARKVGTEVFIGIETEDLPDEDLWDFAGESTRGLPPRNGGPWVVVIADEGGVALRFVPTGGVPTLEREIGPIIEDGARVVHWELSGPVGVPADKLSFRRLGEARMREEASAVIRAVGSHPAFAGLAYHHYGSLRALRSDGRDGTGRP